MIGRHEPRHRAKLEAQSVTVHSMLDVLGHKDRRNKDKGTETFEMMKALANNKVIQNVNHTLVFLLFYLFS